MMIICTYCWSCVKERYVVENGIALISQFYDHFTQSLMEVIERRKTITELEARYFLHQIVLACDHLHTMGVAHCNLRLYNLFLNSKMEIKIGGFGLATKMESKSEDKMMSVI